MADNINALATFVDSEQFLNALTSGTAPNGIYIVNNVDINNLKSRVQNELNLATIATSGAFGDLAEPPTKSELLEILQLSDQGTAYTNHVDWDNIDNKPNDIGGSLPVGANVSNNLSDYNNDIGYISNFTETDPVYIASPAATIQTADITKWNGYNTSIESLNTSLSNISNNLTVSWDAISDKPDLEHIEWSNINNKPQFFDASVLHAVATSGSYFDLEDAPVSAFGCIAYNFSFSSTMTIQTFGTTDIVVENIDSTPFSEYKSIKQQLQQIIDDFNSNYIIKVKNSNGDNFYLQNCANYTDSSTYNYYKLIFSANYTDNYSSLSGTAANKLSNLTFSNKKKVAAIVDMENNLLLVKILN